MKFSICCEETISMESSTNLCDNCFDDEYGHPDNLDGEEYCYVCSDTGSIPCHCGGDLCICLNHGEKPCPNCGYGG